MLIKYRFLNNISHLQSLLKKLSPTILYLLNFFLPARPVTQTLLLHRPQVLVSASLVHQPACADSQGERRPCSALARTHLRCRLLEAIGVQRRHDVNPSVVDQLDYRLVPFLVFVAQVLGQENEQLPSNRLVAMHVPNVFKFRLTYKTEQHGDVFCSTHTRRMAYGAKNIVCLLVYYTELTTSFPSGTDASEIYLEYQNTSNSPSVLLFLSP